MVILFVAYRQPTDLDEFERRYRDEHVALAKAVPHVRRLVLGSVSGGAPDAPAPYCRVAELHFADEADLARAASSPEGVTAVRHAQEIGTGGLDTMVIHVEHGA